MRNSIVALIFVLVFASCDNSSSSNSGSSPSNSDGTLLGAYKAAVAVKGEDQTYTFGPGNEFIYTREQGSCLTEQDTGTAQLQVIQGIQALQIHLTKGSGSDWNYQGTGCPPVVAYTADQIAFLDGPHPFRWVTPGTSFEIQVSRTDWFRFDKI